jgi:hypothetical protein
MILLARRTTGGLSSEAHQHCLHTDFWNLKISPGVFFHRLSLDFPLGGRESVMVFPIAIVKLVYFSLSPCPASQIGVA